MERIRENAHAVRTSIKREDTLVNIEKSLDQKAISAVETSLMSVTLNDEIGCEESA